MTLILTPGPGTYNPTHEKVSHIKRKPEAYFPTSSKVDKVSDESSFLGPGSYNPKSPGTSSYSFGYDNRFKNLRSSSNSTPGPGTYNNTLSLSGKKSFRKESLASNLSRDNSLSARNGRAGSSQSYWHKSRRSRVVKNNRFTPSGGSYVPGPGSYEMNQEGKKAGPSFSFGTDTRKKANNINKDSPDPGAYNPRLSSTAKSYTISKANRFKDMYDNGVPGVGCYYNNDQSLSKTNNIDNSGNGHFYEFGKKPKGFTFGLEERLTGKPHMC